MLDVSVSYNRYKFVGYEFLTWLWFIIETDPKSLGKPDSSPVRIQVGNRIKLENNRHQPETITIKGDEADLEEGMLALRKGSMVTELNVICHIENQIWQFTLRGESLNIGALKTVTEEPTGETADVETSLLDKAYQFEAVGGLVDKIYRQFVKLRVSNDWKSRTIPTITTWINS